MEARELLGLFLLNEKLIIHCLDANTPVLTRDSGWKPISDITTDDYVFHPSGNAVRVVGKSPVWLNQNCFRVTSTDGRSVVVDADHLWTVTDRRRHRSIGPRGSQKEFFQTVTLTTKEMFESGLERWPNREYKGFRYVLPAQQALRGIADSELPIDPYVLGAWLGDGCSNSGELTAHVDDIPHWESAFSALGVGTRRNSTPHRLGIPGIRPALRELGVLNNKHIPEQYLLSSERQREALLQGLMDTDGTAAGGSRASFTNTNRNIADGVLFLARSLGWRASLREISGRSGQKRQYRVDWQARSEDEFCPFRMERKASLLPSGDVRGGRHTFCIKSIEPVESVPVACIRVAGEDGLFLAGDCLMPTHNSAQLFPTANESYLRMCRLIESCPDLDKLVHKKRSGNNNVGIELKNGSRLLYMARGRDPGRGFSGDLVVLDEAYSLAPEMIGALIPALSARPNPQIWYASSTGHEDSDVLLKARDRGLAHEPGIALFEWCADAGASLDDREQWYKANPALGIRLEEDYVELERRSMSDKEFARERLGLWADTQVHAPIDEELWRSLCRCGGESHPECKKVGASQIASRTVVAIDASPDRSWATVALAGYTEDGKKQVEIIQDGRGLSWCVETVERLFASTNNPPPLAVCVQSGARAGALIPEIEALGVEVIPFGTREIMSSTGFFFDSCQDGTLVHLGDKSLAHGLSGARKYMIGGKVGDGEYNGWGWTRTDPTVNITGVCAATYALWGLNMKRTEALQERKSYEGKPRGGRIW